MRPSRFYSFGREGLRPSSRREISLAGSGFDALQNAIKLKKPDTIHVQFAIAGYGILHARAYAVA